jgi:hypothetical protein
MIASARRAVATRVAALVVLLSTASAVAGQPQIQTIIKSLKLQP